MPTKAYQGRNYFDWIYEHSLRPIIPCDPFAIASAELKSMEGYWIHH
jgi:hypothetical protein